MYLFSRQTRLAGGHGLRGVEWAAEMCERVNQSTDLDLSLWGRMFSPEFGTIAFTAFVEDLAQIEAAADTLNADNGYIEASNEGAGLTIGGLDDSLGELVHGAPNPDVQPQYVSVVQSVCANGAAVKGIVLGVELAQKAEAITGAPTLFGRNLTGNYGGVSWISGALDVAGLEANQAALAADPDWAAAIEESTAGVYSDDPSVTEQIIWRKLA